MAENRDINNQIEVTDGNMSKQEAEQPVYDRVYQVYADTRIPVSKSVGKMWNSRWKEIKNQLKQNGTIDRWKEVVAYYQNDHGAMANKTEGLHNIGSGRETEKKFLSENMVFANASALVPATYTKNPDVEITSEKGEADEQKVDLFEKLIDVLFTRKQAPGINIKPKAKRVVLTTTLTNVGYLELSYVQKENGSEAALQEIEALSKQLQEAKTINDVQEIEGKLQALEEKITLLAPAGPKCRVRRPDLVFVDPAAEDGDIPSANFVIIGDYIRTDYLRAMYGTKDENGEWKSIYKPTHVLSGEKDMQGHDDEINNFTLLSDDGEEHEKYGYKTKDDFKSSCHTLCWYVWDKITRRVYLFNDCDWSWPVWVWDDPYKLSRFFPIFALTYTTDPYEMYARSEVMYYLDHQDELNTINNERARMRRWASSKVWIDSNAVKDKTQIESFLGDDSKDLVHSIDLPDGKKIGDIMGTFPAPSTAFEQLFDAKPIMEGINRLSSVTPVLQNVQYKTNTTNKAIESYESSTQMRLDEKIDAIEEFLGDIGNALLELCVQFMTEDEVNNLLGADFVKNCGGWTENINVDEFNRTYNLRVVGGSTLKPTSKVKKEQVMNLGQVLGQFANASPGIIIVLLKAIERAFKDDFVLTPQDWQIITQSTMQQLQRGSAAQGGEQGQPQAQGGQPQQGEQGAQLEQVMAQVEEVVNALPVQAKQFLGEGIAKGVPLKELMMQIMQAAQQQQTQQPQPTRQ
jgi:hypothetical protein